MRLADFAAHWDLVIRDLADTYGIDLYDPTVLARPWPGIRILMWGLIHEPSRLLRALTKEMNDDADRS